MLPCLALVLTCLPLVAQSNSSRIPLTTPAGAYVPSVTDPPKPADRPTGLSPLQTELLAPLDVTRLHPGSTVLAKLAVAWSGQGCSLTQGSTVAGHVAEVDLRSRQNNISRVTILFDTADCNGVRSTIFPSVLVAVLAGTLGGDPNLTEGPPLADAVGLSTGGGARSAQSASAITDFSALPSRRLPAQVLPGQVIGLSRIKLDVGAGVDGGSVLSSPSHNLRLEATTHFILMPRGPEVITASPSAPTAASSSAPATSNAVVSFIPPAPEPVDETEICSSSCNTVPDGSGQTTPSHVAAATLLTSTLGYKPQGNREITSLGYDASLTYLDAGNLLFSFDPHKLRERGGGVHRQAARTVRAVLIDPLDHTVKRVSDWRVYGEGQYIWPAGPARVLAHIGHQLRLLSPNLNVVRSTELRGAIAWVSASPSENRFAVGVYNERHTDDIHQQIFQATGEEPEEDIDVHLFDGDLNLILTVERSSDTHRPVLSDDGEIRLLPGRRGHWQISEYRWDRSTHTIATTRSSCRPDVTSVSSGLLFVLGCGTSETRWYRVLGSNGHPILKADSPSEEIQQSTSSSDPSQFAVRVITAVRTMSPGQPFRRSDLHSQAISIYRSSDGHRLFATSAAQVPLSEQSFAISPSGSQLALLGDSNIAFYSIASGFKTH